MPASPACAPAKWTWPKWMRKGEPLQTHALPFKYSMVLPAFTGVDAVRQVKALCNPRGFVQIDAHQRNPIVEEHLLAGRLRGDSAGGSDPRAHGRAEDRLHDRIDGDGDRGKHPRRPREASRLNAVATWNAICLADMGDTGVAFVALPQIPPRNVTWAKEGKWVHLAKVAFEKYFLMKMKSGNTEPVYEKYVLKLLGILRTK